MTGDTELGLLFREPFPEPEPGTGTVAAAAPGRSHRGRFRRPNKVTAIIVIVVLIGAGVGIWAATGSSAATYRWATVTKADIDQTLNSYGTVTPIHQANVAFPVSGTVATVPVTVGQQVKAGQALATLQTSSLQSRLDSAKSSLATAQAKLVSDEAAQAGGTTATATSTSATLSGADTGHAAPLATPSRSGPTGGSSSSAESAVTAAQSKLLADQKTVDQLTGVVAADLRAGMTTCASLIQSLKNLAVTPMTPTPAASPSAAGGSGGSGGGHVPDTTACTDLLNKILADQQAVTAAQTTVSNDEMALTSAVNALAAQAKSGSGSSGGSTGSGSSGGSSTSRSGTGSFGNPGSSSSFSGSGRTSSGGGGTAVTAEQLVVDQATVDADAANAIVAAEALNQATLVSPLAGTVAAINISPGTSAGASSTAITVIGPGADQVSTTITDLQLKEVHLGSDATVIPDGSTTSVHGTVTAIGLLPVSSTTSSSSSTSSSATYPVTISLDTSGLYSGSGADVSIVVKKLSHVLAVPTSAVTSLGALHTVTVQSGGQAKRQIVVVGAADPSHTQSHVRTHRG